MFWFPIQCYKINHKGKSIKCTFAHPKVKCCCHIHTRTTKLEIIITWKFTKLKIYLKICKTGQGTLPNPHSMLLSSLFNVVHCKVDGGWVDGYSFALGCQVDGYYYSYC